MKNKINKKTLLSFLACILLTALCVSAFAYADSRHKISNDTTEGVSNAALTAALPGAIDSQSYKSSGIFVKSPNNEVTAEIVRKNNSKFDSLIFTGRNNQNQIVDLENILYTNIINASWIDDTRFAIVGHINPGLNVYVVADAKNDTVIGEYYGLGFTWNKNKNKLYYIQTSPYFSSVQEHDKIVDNNNNVYYEAAPGTTLADKLSVSEDEQTFAFFVNGDSKEQRKLYITKLNNNSKLEKQSEIDAPVGEKR